MIFWVTLEELFLVEQTKCQTLETLIKPLEVLFTVTPVYNLSKIPIEDIPSIEHLLLLHFLAVAPNP